MLYCSTVVSLLVFVYLYYVLYIHIYVVVETSLFSRVYGRYVMWAFNCTNIEYIV